MSKTVKELEMAFLATVVAYDDAYSARAAAFRLWQDALKESQEV